MNVLIHALRRFQRDDRGNLFVEAVVVLPFLMWAYVGLFAFWDAYRSVNAVQKAAYAVSDMISREQTTITPAYLAGMDAILERLIEADQEAALRVTSVYFDEVDNRNEVHWSVSPGGTMPALTTALLQAEDARIPEMSDGDFVVIIEVVVNYEATIDVGVTNMDIEQFIVTRPRFVPKICMQGFACA